MGLNPGLAMLLGGHKAAGGGAFTPADLTLAAWYDASNAGSITSAGGAVSQWNDLSGNGRHLTQSTAAAKPGTGAQTHNGLNVLTFDGGDHMDYDAGSDAIDLSPVTFFVVMRLASTTDTFSRPFSLRRSATGAEDYQSPNFTIARQNADSLNWNSAGTTIGTNKSYTDDTMFAYYGRCDGSTMYHAINNGAVHSIAASAPANMRYLRVGAACTSTSNPPAVDQRMTGRIAEIVIANEDLSAGDITSMWSYINTKWAV